MTNAILTHLEFLLDRSGSMASMHLAAVNGFNRFIQAQRAHPGRTTVSLKQFDNVLESVFSHAPIHEAILASEDFQPRGGTALLDAVATTVDRLGAELAACDPAQRPGKVIVAILTDGEENSSLLYRPADVQARIVHQQSVYGWEFVFLGASAHWLDQARDLGIAPKDAMLFEATSEGVTKVFSCLESVVAEKRG